MVGIQTGTRRLYLYDISADGGKTWTAQWLYEDEAVDLREHFTDWIIVKSKYMEVSQNGRRY